MASALALTSASISASSRSYAAISALYLSESRSAIFWYLSRSPPPMSFPRREISSPSSRTEVRCSARAVDICLGLLAPLLLLLLLLLLLVLVVLPVRLAEDEADEDNPSFET